MERLQASIRYLQISNNPSHNHQKNAMLKLCLLQRTDDPSISIVARFPVNLYLSFYFTTIRLVSVVCALKYPNALLLIFEGGFPGVTPPPGPFCDC